MHRSKLLRSPKHGLYEIEKAVEKRPRKEGAVVDQLESLLSKNKKVGVVKFYKFFENQHILIAYCIIFILYHLSVTM